MTPAQLRRAKALLDAFPIEVAELRASDKQLAFQRAFLDRRDPETGEGKDIFAALGGNRSGKSIVCGWLCFAKYLRDRARDGDWFWCVGQTLDRSIGGQQKELWNALPKWMFGAVPGAARSRHNWQVTPQQWDEKIGFGMHRKLVLPTADGGRCLVEFRSADQAVATFEQAKLAGVWCDERLPEEVYDRLLPRIIDRDGWILYSDIPEQWWQVERLEHAEPAAGVYFRRFRMYDNAPNLPGGAIDKAKARMTSDQQQQRIDGEFVVMEGLVYKEFRARPYPAGHLCDPFPIPDDWPKWLVIDYGASAPTAGLWAAIAPNERVYLYREYYQAGLSVGRNAEAMLAMSADDAYDDGRGRGPRRGAAAYRRILMDPHAVDPPPVTYGQAKTIARQYAEAGIESTGWPFVQVMGEHSMVQRVKYRLETMTVCVFSTLRELRREFGSWKFKTDKEGKPLAADAFEHANNHLLDCLKGFLGTNPCFAAPAVEVVGGS
jgi:hypothetical protein